MIQHASNLTGEAKLHNEDPAKYQTGSKALVQVNPGQHMLNNKNPDSNPNKKARMVQRHHY